jgi:hypothetical protein
MLVDSTRIRRDSRRDYDRARRALERGQAELEAFEKQDLPQFREWMHTTFGTLLSELRETSRDLHARQGELEDIEMAAGFWGCSLRTAWIRLQRGEAPAFSDDPARGEPGAPDDDEADGEGGDDPWSAPPGEDAGEYSEEEAELFARLFGFDPRTTKAPGQGEGVRHPTNREDERRARDAYRQIARRVHPDTHGREPSPAIKAIWYEAQDAYRTRDAGRLELLLFRLDLEAGKQQPGKAPVSMLRQLTQRLKRTLQDVRRKMRQQRLDPAWGFRHVKNRARLAGSIEFALSRDRDALRRELRGLESALNRIRRPTAPNARADRRPSREGPASARQPDLPF